MEDQERIPSLQSTLSGYCIVCSTNVTRSLKQMPAKTIDEYLRVILKLFEELFPTKRIPHKNISVYDQIEFCEKCVYSLQKFQEIQLRLTRLTLQLQEVKKTLSKELVIETTSSRIRNLFTPGNNAGLQYTLTTIKQEVITEDSFTNGLDFEPLGFELQPISETYQEADDDEIDMYNLGLPSFARKAHPMPNQQCLQTLHRASHMKETDLKPCQVKLVRLEMHRLLDKDQDGSICENNRQRRLKKLLKGQKSKQRRHAAGKRNTEKHNQKRLTVMLIQLKKKTQNNKPKTTKILTRIRCPKSECTRHFATEEILRFHIRKLHENCVNVYNCLSCEAEFGILKELRHHERKMGHMAAVPEGLKAQRKRTIDCEKCRILFKREKSFKRHLEVQGGQCTRAPLPLNCIFDRAQPYLQRYICSHCERKFRSPQAVAVHIRVRHTDGFAYLCEFCCKQYRSKQTLLSHQRQLHPDELLATQTDPEAILDRIKKLTCEICDVTFTSVASKRDHDAIHTKKYKLFCEVCGAGFMNTNRLQTHMAVHVPVECRFACTDCALKFSRKENLNRHVRVVHKRERKCQCEHCSKSFADKTALKRHMRLLHKDPLDPNANDFKCDICSYACAIKDYLTIHGKTKKHLQSVAKMGLTDPNSGLNFNISNKKVTVRKTTSLFK